MKSLYQRQFMIMAGVILFSFLLLGMSFATLTYRYTISEKQTALRRNAEYIAQVASEAMTSSDELGGFSIKAALFRPTVEAVAEVGDATVLLCIYDGEIIYASDDGQDGSILTGKILPAEVTQAIRATGSFSAVTDLSGLFPQKRYVAGSPIIRDHRGSAYLVGMALVSAQTSSITEMWRAFANIYVATAIVVLLMAFMTSSLTAMRMTRPLKEMADAVRRFGHGEYDTRVDPGDRNDEVGELAEAFNSMADNIAQSEAKRSEFVANISHELKTPMTTIAGFADGILDGTIPPEREKEYLGVISAETRRLSRLVRRMLDLSRLQSAEHVTAQEQFDVSEIMLRVLVSLEGKINARELDVDTQFPDDPVQVWGDPDAITQVCYNLLDNAIKFSDPGSTMGVKVAVKGGKAYVSVRNTGETIPPEEIPLLFDRFHKSDRSRSEDREGVGLGLYIVQTILNNHKENITCTSENGVTEFTFTLTTA